MNRRVRHVDTDIVSAIDFSISPQTRDEVFTAGHKAAREFLDLQGQAAEAAAAVVAPQKKSSRSRRTRATSRPAQE